MKSILNIYRLLKKKELKKVGGLTSILILLITIFPLSGCGQDKNKIADIELERNHRLWQESKIINYNFVSTKYQGGTSAWVPVLIMIRNGTAISMEPVRERGEFLKIEGYEDFDTVEKMFERIQESYNNGDKAIVTYNQKFGYPENIRIEPEKGGIDTGFSIEISKFEVIKN